jgi:hypothetical protein
MKNNRSKICGWLGIGWIVFVCAWFLVSEAYATYLWIRGQGYDEGISGHFGRAFFSSLAAMPGILLISLGDKLQSK